MSKNGFRRKDTFVKSIKYNILCLGIFNRIRSLLTGASFAFVLGRVDEKIHLFVSTIFPFHTIYLSLTLPLSPLKSLLTI